jgi:hypothetical protein
MHEKLRREVLTGISTWLTDEQLIKLDNVLTTVLTRYEITEKSTEIALYRDGIPEEIKSFLVCKSIKGLTKSCLVHYKRTLEHFANNITKDIKELNANDIRLYLLSYEQTHNTGKSAMDDKRRVFK